MGSNDIRKDQAAALFRGVQPGLRYLARLRSRMERAGFLPNAPLLSVGTRRENAEAASQCCQRLQSNKQSRTSVRRQRKAPAVNYVPQPNGNRGVH